MRPVILVADDYAISPGVSEIIRTLIESRRLTATGCMTLFPDWPQAAALLRPLQPLADVGLHFTLTDHPPLATLPRLAPNGRLPTMGKLLPQALLRQLPLDEVRCELNAQLDAFEAAWGSPPDFVDGHQHAHVLPGVRDVLIEEVLRRYGPRQVYLRDCFEPLGRCLQRGVAWPKALLISSLAAGLSRRIQRLGLRRNRGFAGLHDFSGQPPFSALMPRFLALAGECPMVHVHPGRVDGALASRDTLTTPREREWHYLASEAFLNDLKTAGLRPARFAETEQHAS